MVDRVAMVCCLLSSLLRMLSHVRDVFLVKAQQGRTQDKHGNTKKKIEKYVSLRPFTRWMKGEKAIQSLDGLNNPLLH